MITKEAMPIAQNWTTQYAAEPAEPTATAAVANSMLARLEVADIDAALIPHLAAAAAELALVAGISWRFSVDDAPVALLRLIAKVALVQPQSSGPHTARLCAQLGYALLG